MNTMSVKIERKSQTSEIIKHLKKHRSITSKEAIKLYGATRLSSIIYALRARGYGISTEKLYGVNRYGNKVPYAKYWLDKEELEGGK